MTSQMSLRDSLSCIYDNSNNYSLRELGNKTYRFSSLIKENTTDEIYENYKIESDCVYYEMIYGNNDEYTENVKNSFLNSLKIVIDSL
jgi:hypothetical protein